MVDARWADGWQHGSQIRQTVSQPVVVFVVGDFPGGMSVENDIDGRCAVVGRQTARLKFQGGDDARGLLGIKVYSLLSRGFGGVDGALARGKGQARRRAEVEGAARGGARRTRPGATAR